jgi:hypothetical protein
MFLLELTEKELEVLRDGLIKEKYSWEDKDPLEVSRTTIENKLNSCHSSWSKLDSASNSQKEVLITARDLIHIVSLAKTEYTKLRGDLHISEKRVEESDFVHIALANVLIMWLNNKDCLKKLAKFDYTDQSAQFEEME